MILQFQTLAEAGEEFAQGASAFGKYLVPGFIPKKGLVFIYGPSGSMKTVLACALAVEVAAGGDWFGSRLERCPVLYLAAEDSEGVKARLLAEAHARNLDASDTQIMIGCPPKTIHSNGWNEDVYGVASRMVSRFELAPGLVVLDTLGANFGGQSQDDAGPMSRAMDALLGISNTLNCAVVVMHHTGKDPSRGMRGSQVPYDRADTVLRMQPKGETVVATVQKQRNGPSGLSFTFGRRATRLYEDASVVVIDRLCPAIQPHLGNSIPPLPASARRRESANAALLQRLLDGLAAEGVCEIDKEQLRRQFCQAKGSDNASTLRGAWREALRVKAASETIVEASGTIRIIGGESVGVAVGVGSVGEPTPQALALATRPL